MPTGLLLRRIDGVGGPAESHLCRTHLGRRAAA